MCHEFDRHLGKPASENPNVAEYDYYPREFFGVYKDRRRKVGFYLYALLGIGKDDKKPGNMYQHLGDNEAERQANLALFKAWVGNWSLKKFDALTKDDLAAIKVTY